MLLFPEQRSTVEQAERELKALYTALGEIEAGENFQLLRARLLEQQQSEVKSIPSIDKRPMLFRYVASAAAIIAVAMSLLWFYGSDSQESNDIDLYVTQPAEKKNLRLPDGTVVKLNADSRIELDAAFGESNRTVTLVGEAYMEVAKNTALPFIVKTSMLDVRVLGTTLNIRAYSNEERAEASLIEGSAEVLVKESSAAPIRLKPMEKVVVASDDDGAVPRPLQAPATLPKTYTLETVTHYDANDDLAETSWTKQKLVFVNQPLIDIAKTLERWYDVKIVFENEKIMQRKYTAAFDDKEQLMDVLEVLRLSIPFEYQAEGTKTIKIGSK